MLQVVDSIIQQSSHIIQCYHNVNSKVGPNTNSNPDYPLEPYEILLTLSSTVGQ